MPNKPTGKHRFSHEDMGLSGWNGPYKSNPLREMHIAGRYELIFSPMTEPMDTDQGCHLHLWSPLAWKFTPEGLWSMPLDVYPGTGCGFAPKQMRGNDDKPGHFEGSPKFSNNLLSQLAVWLGCLEHRDSQTVITLGHHQYAMAHQPKASLSPWLNTWKRQIDVFSHLQRSPMMRPPYAG